VQDEVKLLEQLRAGDEAAFSALVERYQPSLLRFAATFVPNRAVAEEVVQDAWIGVIRGIERFEGRSTLQTWLYRIVANRARTTGARERRSIPAAMGDEPAVAISRFGRAGHWADPPAPWPDDVEDRLVAAGLAERLRAWIDELPDGQRQVVMMRDVEGLSSGEVCEILGVTEGNQRVLLHRGRARIRARIEDEMKES
jgi:RNA polymerase sigma-70 factor (ECF subfamily)